MTDHALAAVRIACAGLAKAGWRREQKGQHGQGPDQRLRHSHLVTAFGKLRRSETACLVPLARALFSRGFLSVSHVILDRPIRILMSGSLQWEIARSPAHSAVLQ
jgi:hypothetical protein